MYLSEIALCVCVHLCTVKYKNRETPARELYVARIRRNEFTVTAKGKKKSERIIYGNKTCRYEEEERVE